MTLFTAMVQVRGNCSKSVGGLDVYVWTGMYLYRVASRSLSDERVSQFVQRSKKKKKKKDGIYDIVTAITTRKTRRYISRKQQVRAARTAWNSKRTDIVACVDLGWV